MFSGLGSALCLSEIITRLLHILDESELVVKHLSVPKPVDQSFGVGRAYAPQAGSPWDARSAAAIAKQMPPKPSNHFRACQEERPW